MELAMESHKLEELLHHAAAGNYFEVQSLVNEGVDPDGEDSEGRTPLMLAAKESHKEVIEVLINLGADIHCCDNKGLTVLHHASIWGSMEIVQYLVNKGVVLDMRDFNGITPLMWATQQSRGDIVELLINLDADVHCCDNNGWTALHHAVLGESVYIVQSLVSKGAALDVKNHLGLTPLHLATSLRDTETSQYLLKAGADWNLKDNVGESPFNYLTDQRLDIETIKLFIEKGAYLKSTDYNNLLEDPLLKEVILQDIKLSSQAVINKFNNRDLPLLYKELSSSQKLPPIDIMKIGNESGMALEVKRAVAHEIEANGFCNVFEMVPLVLSMLCVKSLEKSRLAFNESNLSASQNGSKRLGDYNEQDYPCKKIRN